MPKLHSVQELEEVRAGCLKEIDAARPCITVCAGSGCQAAGALDVLKALRASLKGKGMQDAVEVKSTGCHGFCEKGPVMIVWPEGTFYNKVSQRDAKDIVASATNGRKPVERLLYKDPTTGERVVREDEVPFYARQQRVLFGNNGRIDPKNIEDYFRVGGYKALAQVLTRRTPYQIVEDIKRSGLRGRGGAGFPTEIGRAHV